MTQKITIFAFILALTTGTLLAQNDCTPLMISYPNAVCNHTSSLPAIAASGVSTGATVYWYDTKPTQKPPTQQPIATGSIYSIDSQYNTVGIHTFYAVQYANGCWSNPASTTLTVNPNPPAPIIARRTSCSSDDILALYLAVPDPVGIHWYDETGKDLECYSKSFIPDSTMLKHDQQTSFLVDYKDATTGCLSIKGTGEYFYVVNPKKPVIQGNLLVCPEVEPGLLITSKDVGFENNIINWWYKDSLIGVSVESFDLNSIPDLNKDVWSKYAIKVEQIKELNGIQCKSDSTIVLQVSLCDDIKEYEPESNLLIYPNPVENELYVSLDSELSEELPVTISNLSGDMLLQSTISHDAKIDVSELKAGTYIVTVKSKEKTYSAKFYKE